jgi:hypothetical protein
MVGIAIWHAAIFVPDRFYGGIIGAFLAAVAGALVTGYLLPTPGVPPHNPPGLAEALWPMPGSALAIVAAYVYGARREPARARTLARGSGMGAPASAGQRLRARQPGTEDREKRDGTDRGTRIHNP